MASFLSTVGLVLALGGVFIFIRIGIRRITVLEYERGVRYTRGKFSHVLEPGQYWYLPYFTMIHKLDVRPAYVPITGQEALSADGVTLKVSLAANFRIVDPNTAVNHVMNYQQALYLELQLALREIIGAVDIDIVLSGRDALSQRLMAIARPKANDLGLELISVNVKDVMFPGKLKEIFAQVVSAKQEGLAALEKSRAESAALRHLANAARMVEGNPTLMQLRLLQTLGASSGHTVILGLPNQQTLIPVRKGDKTGGGGGDE